MLLDLIHKIPNQMEEILGPEGRDQFLAFLEEALTVSKNAILEVSFQQYETVLKFEISQVYSAIEAVKTTLSGEIEKLRYEIAVKIVNLQGEILDLRAEMKINFSEVNSKILKLQFEFEMETAKIRKELKTEIADLRAETKTDFLELQKSIVDIHKTIATQTRWILGGMLGVATLFAAIGKVIN
ncbi:hypothetical protein LEP1GSC111_2397 [Leptospira interrogans str. UT126]|uniref:LA_3696 family protein n=1 Tax=Leptospira interrogans TaxID=173 RepID=UPI0002C03C18|nr:hypothetical protein LEP1GSC111_2397 [Leptospira interrogans str. UT126]